MASVKGSGDTTMGNNPAVRSKFDKSHGKGLPAPHLSFPGQTAPVTGTKVGGFNPNGRMVPKEVTKTGTLSLNHRSPAELGTQMANGQRTAPKPNMAQTGRVPNPTRQGMPSAIDVNRNASGLGVSDPMPRLGTQVKMQNKPGTSDNTVKRASTRQDAGVLSGQRKGYMGSK